MAKVGILIVVLLVAVAGGYYYTLYPPLLKQRQVEHALKDFGTTIATKDREKIDTGIKQLLSDSVQIHLEVGFVALNPQHSSNVDSEDFDRDGFISFVDNVLYSLSDYSFSADIQDFKLSADRKTADVTFVAKAWGEGMSYYAGVGSNMRFNSLTTCKSQVEFEDAAALGSKARCPRKILILYYLLTCRYYNLKDNKRGAVYGV